jgi:D-3-phosphoglycerate dehydrogenase
MTQYRVALSADFRKADGTPAFPDFDLTPLTDDRRVAMDYVAAEDGVIPGSRLEEHDALILLGSKVTKASLPKSGRLGVVARFGVGYDNVDVEGLADEGVATVITPAGVARPVAVGILTFVLALAGKVFAKDRLARQGATGFAQRADHMGIGLIGKTLGSVGLGNIGAEMVRVMRPLGLAFIAHDPYIDAAKAKDLGVRLVDLETVFRDSDFVTVNCPLNENTRKLVNARRLGLMKPTAYFINTARGPIVDQPALVGVLKAGRIAGAAIDVFDPEPPSPDDPLLALGNVILAPHGLAWTDQCFADCGRLDVEAVLDVMRGRAPKGIVVPRVLEHPAWRRRLEANAKRFGAG